MRLIAISAPRRDPAMPDVPTIAETVPGFEMAPWWGLFAPAGTAREVIGRLNTESVRILALPDVKANYANLGLLAASNSPEQFNAFVQDEIVRWAKVVKASGARAD
jgi:tripartite-type tricarboxylate transporter receptor subunit TctC